MIGLTFPIMNGKLRRGSSERSRYRSTMRRTGVITMMFEEAKKSIQKGDASMTLTLSRCHGSSALSICTPMNTQQEGHSITLRTLRLRTKIATKETLSLSSSNLIWRGDSGRSIHRNHFLSKGTTHHSLEMRLSWRQNISKRSSAFLSSLDNQGVVYSKSSKSKFKLSSKPVHKIPLIRVRSILSVIAKSVARILTRFSRRNCSLKKCLLHPRWVQVTRCSLSRILTWSCSLSLRTQVRVKNQ